MAEKTPPQQLAEKLLYTPAYAADKSADVKKAAADFAEGYRKFLDNGKTEREVAAESEQMLKDAGYQLFAPKKTYAPGDKVYFIQLNKAVVASTIGTRPYEEGFHLVIAHTDSPRLDLRPNPLYESDHFSYFKTHYYGGIRKYQWGTMPLAIHGVFSRADGTTVSVNVGEDESDPVFCITDLLPHLGAEQNERKLSEGIKAEELNILIGSEAVEDADIKEAVKLNTMILLNEKYGITEKDFTRAEIEVVPAYKCRDVGVDRALLGGIMGFSADDTRIRDSFAIATERGLAYSFTPNEAETDIYPNTVDIRMENAAGQVMTVRGESLGGGKVRIVRINGVEVDFTGEYNALIVVQQDKPGVLAHITKILSDRGVNIAFMRLFREEKGHTAYTIVESDERLPEGVDRLLLENPNIRDVMVVQQ